MTFTTKKSFIDFMTQSGYRQLGPNKVYRADDEKIALYAWDDISKKVNQIIISKENFENLHAAVC